ncbi:MAG: hypothetical protein NT092_09540 [Bacteroidia bacterium]|nr:hypothetical protein [Bacteroidia bacterium]
MNMVQNISGPFQFNPLKHHLFFIKGFIADRWPEEKKTDIKNIVKELKHIGSSVMDVYSGSLSVEDICKEIREFLHSEKLDEINIFSGWAGIKIDDFKTIALSDTSLWMLKYHNDEKKFVHIFPARLSPHSFRIKANTLKSAILYYILIGKDFVTGEDLNKARSLLGLSPVKNTTETEAITEMIEILRS